MYKRILIAIILIVAGIGLWQSGLINRAGNVLASWGITNKLKDSVQSNEFLPSPLRGSFDADNTVLTVDGIIEETNKQREQNGATPLHRNERLNKAAEAKLDDMFRQQYFEHNSPDGKGPADVIKGQGYEYIVVGENLALGNFGTDVKLVQAWMDSPGHRANILHPTFQEMGAAAKKGMYEGREVWIAVQEFGTPLSQCPSPSASLQEQIKTNRAQLQTWQTELAEMKRRLDSSKNKSSSAYEEQVDDYNALAKKTNALSDSTRQLVDQYNAAVNSFNKCLDANV